MDTENREENADGFQDCTGAFPPAGGAGARAGALTRRMRPAAKPPPDPDRGLAAASEAFKGRYDHHLCTVVPID